MVTESPITHSPSALTAPSQVRFRAGNIIWAALALIGIFVSWAVGFSIGRLSTFAQASPAAAPAPPIVVWQYRLPKLSDKINASYRSLLEETAVGVDAVMKSHPENANAISALALFHYLAHDGVGEEKCWERCLAVDPRNALAYSRLVALAQQNGNYSRIVELMRQALKLDPQNSVNRGMLASALMFLNRSDEAREQLEANLRAGAATVDTYLVLGEVSNQQNRFEKAKRYLELAVDMSPDRMDALYNLFKVCTKLGLNDEAKQYLERFQKLKAEQQSGEAVRTELQDHIYMPPRIAEIETFIGKAYFENHDVVQAEKYFRQAAQRAERDLESRKMMAQLMSAMGKWGEAIRWTKELGKLDSGNGLHYWNEGVLYTRARLYDDAERVFRDICRLEPARDTGYASLAELYLETNQKLDEARTLAERAVELEPTARNHWILASVAQKQRDYVTARAVLNRALAIDPQNAALRKMYDSLPQ